MTRMLFTTPSLAVYALTFLSGVTSMQYFRLIPDIFWLAYLPLFLLIRYYSVSTRLLAIFLCGLLWSLLHAHWYFLHSLPEELVGKTIIIEGVITDIPRRQEKTQKFLFEVRRFNDQISGYHPQTIKLSWYRTEQELRAGQYWRLKVRLKPPHGFSNPGGFDYERWLFQQKIHATGYVRSHPQNRQIASYDYSIDTIRDEIVRNISAYTSGFSGLIAALSVGHKVGITDDQWTVLRHTGTSHLMAISGLHIGLIASMVFWLSQRCAPCFIFKTLPSSQFASIVSLLVTTIYALLAGFAVPTQRALVMLCVVLGGIMLRRQVKPLNSLSLALIAVLVFDPVSILSLGFWFSFLAVAVIAYGFGGRLGQPKTLIQWWRLQWIIALALFPLSLFLFQQASIIGPVANLLFVPWVSFVVVPIVLLANLSLLFSTTLAQGFYTLAEWSFECSWPLLEWLSKSNVASWQQANIDVHYLLLATIAMLLFIAPRGVTHKWLAVVMLLPLFMYQDEVPKQGDVWVDVLDVGQGLASVIRTRNHVMVFDTGPKFSPTFDAGERVIVPFLQSSGVKNLDLLLVSHGDNDHIGGAKSLLELFPVSRVMGQGIDRLDHNSKMPCLKGLHWTWDEVDFEVLHPDGYYTKRNNMGCVLRISTAKNSVLMTADIEKKIETKLVKKQPERLKSDVLLVPHHGSKTSSTKAFIHAVDADYAIVSSGYNNRFQHPNADIVQQYNAFEIPIYNTAELGNIHIRLNARKKLNSPRSYRKQVQHYWNHTQ